MRVSSPILLHGCTDLDAINYRCTGAESVLLLYAKVASRIHLRSFICRCAHTQFSSRPSASVEILFALLDIFVCGSPVLFCTSDGSECTDAYMLACCVHSCARSGEICVGIMCFILGSCWGPLPGVSEGTSKCRYCKIEARRQWICPRKSLCGIPASRRRISSIVHRQVRHNV